MKRTFFRLLGYELRKSFLSPWMLVFIALLLLLNGWNLKDSYETKMSSIARFQQTYEDFYSRWKGPITMENINELMEIYNVLDELNRQGKLSSEPDDTAYTYSQRMDYLFFGSAFLREMRYDYLYQNTAIGIAEKAKELEQLYSAVGNGFEAKKNQITAQLFTGRTVPQFADTHWAEVWMNHDYSAMLVLLLCLFGLCPVFVTERESEMYMLLRTARMGGGYTVAAKLLASLLFVTVVSLAFFAEDVLVLLLLSGHPEILSSPVYAIRYLVTTPLNMTVGQFMLWTVGVKTLGILGCGCYILLLSCLFKRVLSVFVAGFGTVMVLTLLQEFCRTRYGLKWFNPMELVISREIVTETEFVNLLGEPVMLHVFVMAGVALTMGLLYAGILYCNPGRMGRR